MDFGDVCVNYDIAWFADHGIAPPTTLDDLLLPEYNDLLVVREPGDLVARARVPVRHHRAHRRGWWQQYWTDLRANGVEVVDSWDSAYYERFSGAAGRRATSRWWSATAAARRQRSSSPTRRATTPRRESCVGTCFRQIEYAGVLRGTTHPNEAAQLMTFLLGEQFQKGLPLTLFVYPANPAVPLPECSPSSPSYPPTRSSSTRRRSPPTASSGRTSGTRSCSVDRAREPASPLVGARPRRGAGGGVVDVLRVAAGHVAGARGPASARSPTRSASPGLGRVLWFTLWQAVVSTVLTMVIGFAPAYLLARYRFPGRRATAGDRHRAVHAADRRRRRSVPRAAPSALARHGASP